MSRAIDWTTAMDRTLTAMRDQGHTCNEIAMVLGVSKNAIINRLDRLGQETGAAFRRRKAMADALHLPSLSSLPSVAPACYSARDGLREGDALPVGHPIAWECISGDAFPGIAYLSAGR